MVNYLKSRGFDVIPVTKSNLTNVREWISPIDSNHALVTCQLVKKGEASWVFNWGGLKFHNFAIAKSDYLDFFNWPIVSAFVIFKKEWK